jgi:hypothetical protein
MEVAIQALAHLVKSTGEITLGASMKNKRSLSDLEAAMDKAFQDHLASLPPGPRAAKLVFMKSFLDWKWKQSKQEAE